MTFVADDVSVVFVVVEEAVPVVVIAATYQPTAAVTVSISLRRLWPVLVVSGTSRLRCDRCSRLSVVWPGPIACSQ